MPTLISYFLNKMMAMSPVLKLSIFLILDPNKVITIIKQRMRRNITKTIKAATIIT